MGREGKGKLASRAVAHDDKFLRIKIMFMSILDEKIVGGANVVERSRPRSTFISNPAIFEICRGDPLGRERSAQVSGVIESVFGAPESTVDVEEQWVGFWFRF